MKVIIEKIIENKVAKLVLASDNVTVQVWYNDKLIDESAGGTWKNISGGLEEGYLDITVDTHIESRHKDNDFNNLVKKLGW